MLNKLRRRVAERRVRRRLKRSGVDVDELLQLARLSFVRLQAAWDAGDLQALSSCMTEPLLEDLRLQLQQRGPAPNCTEVISLRAELKALEDLHEAYVASVEFSGVIRERDDSAAAPFRELWLLAQPKHSAPGWRVAGVQALG